MRGEAKHREKTCQPAKQLNVSKLVWELQPKSSQGDLYRLDYDDVIRNTYSKTCHHYYSKLYKAELFLSTSLH